MTSTTSDGFEQPRQHDHQRQLRDHQEPVLERVEDPVGPCRRSSRRSARRPSRARRDERRGEADDDRHAGADEQLREHVGADLGGAEQCSLLGGCEHVGARRVRVVRREQRAEDRRRTRTAPMTASANACRAWLASSDAHAVLHPRVEEEVQAVGEQVQRRSPTTEKTRNTPCSIGKSLALIASELEQAEAGPREDRLDRDDAAHHDAELDRRQRHQRQQRVAAPRACARPAPTAARSRA